MDRHRTLRRLSEFFSSVLRSWLCRGEATRWGGDLVTLFQANVPVVFSGVGIFPGDYVYADSAGAVAISRSQIRAMLKNAVRVAEEDGGYREATKAEGPSAPSSQ